MTAEEQRHGGRISVRQVIVLYPILGPVCHYTVKVQIHEKESKLSYSPNCLSLAMMFTGAACIHVFMHSYVPEV